MLLDDSRLFFLHGVNPLNFCLTFVCNRAYYLPIPTFYLHHVIEQYSETIGEPIVNFTGKLSLKKRNRYCFNTKFSDTDTGLLFHTKRNMTYKGINTYTVCAISSEIIH